MNFLSKYVKWIILVAISQNLSAFVLEVDSQISPQEFIRKVGNAKNAQVRESLFDFAYQNKRVDLLKICAQSNKLWAYLSMEIGSESPPEGDFRDQLALMLLRNPILTDEIEGGDLRAGIVRGASLRSFYLDVLNEHFPEEGFDSKDNFLKNRKFAYLSYRKPYGIMLEDKLNGYEVDLREHREKMRLLEIEREQNRLVILENEKARLAALRAAGELPPERHRPSLNADRLASSSDNSISSQSTRNPRSRWPLILAIVVLSASVLIWIKTKFRASKMA